MSTVIRISGADVERLKNSLSVHDAINQRSTASFVVVDRDGSATYQKGQSVSILTDLPIPPFAHPEFVGFIETATQRKVAPSAATLYWHITCIDNHYLADKRIAAEVYTAETAGGVVEDLITNYLAAEGVAVGEVQAGPTFDEVVINYQPISQVLNVLAEKANFIWYIDKFKELHFIERTTDEALFDISTGDINKEGRMSSSLKESNPSYRNTQYLRAGKAQTGPQIETKVGDGIAQAFSLGYPLFEAPTVTVNAVPQTVGLKGIDSGMDCYWQKGDTIITFDAGSTPGIVLVVFTYIGEYDVFVLTEDAAAITDLQLLEGGTGIVENMADDPTAITRDDALDAALAKLSKFGITGQIFSFPIGIWGLIPGMMVTVTYAAYGLSADDLLVESVEVSEFGPNELRYHIKAIAGPELGDWTGFFKRLSEQEGNILNRLTIGEDRIIHILKRQIESLTLVESTDSHTDAYPPDVSRWIALYPAQGASHHVRHEALALAEVPADTETTTEAYAWG